MRTKKRLRGRDEFVLTEQHVKLLRNTCTSWYDAEFGAPCIDPKRPYGNSSVYHDMIRILEIDAPADEDGEYAEQLYEQLRNLHEELETALEVVLSAGSFEPGVYCTHSYGSDWMTEAEYNRRKD